MNLVLYGNPSDETGGENTIYIAVHNYPYKYDINCNFVISST